MQQCKAGMKIPRNNVACLYMAKLLTTDNLQFKYVTIIPMQWMLHITITTISINCSGKSKYFY